MKKLITLILVATLGISTLACLSACDPVVPPADDTATDSNTDTHDTVVDTTPPDADTDSPNADTDSPEADASVLPEFRYNKSIDNIEISYDEGETWIAIGTSFDIDPSITSYSYPVDNIKKLSGTIADKTNKYISADNDKGGYHGGLIDLSNLNYSHVQLVRNSNGRELGYAFLSASLTLNSSPSYASGYSHCVWDPSASVVLEIPSNAKYLYVYYNSEANIHLPSSVTFLSAYSNPLNNESAKEYTYPLEKLDLISGYVNSANFFTSSTSKKSAIINIDNISFNTVTLRKNADADSMTYAFVGDEIYAGNPLCYSAGYTGVVTTSDDSITVKIPDNARYLFVSYKNGSTILLPAEIRFSKEAYEVKANSVRIATWNIGHYSLGKKPNSTLEDTQLAMQSAYYTDYINNAINADIIFLNEYSKNFTKNGNPAKNTIFKDYNKVVYEGPQLGYSCNAVYSKIDISNPEMHELECNKTAGKISVHDVRATDYYFVTTDLVINGTTVKLVSAHLAFDGEGSKDVVINQFKELIAYCNQFEHVVLLGDWNVGSFSEFDLFTEAGYTLANADKNMATYNSGSSLDNIIYKGVTVSDFGLAGTDLSDHYALYCTITVEKE